MIHTKRAIFMILPLLFVPLVYGLSSTPDACALPPDPGWMGSRTCGGESTNADGETTQTCCWKEGEVMYCQTCTWYHGVDQAVYNCKPKVAQTTTPTPAPTGTLTPGNVQNLPTLEQVPTTTTPPLFGQSPAEQPPTLAPTQPTPGDGGAPTQGGAIEGSPQTVTPEITQDDNQGGGLPSIKDREDLPSDNEITEQPDTEDDGQDDTSEDPIT